MNLEQLDFASKKKLVRDACHLYLRIKNLNISNKIASKYNMSVKRQLEIDNNLKIKSFFEQVLDLLSPTSHLIIENLYLKRDISKNWFDKYFCKTTYYKRKHDAIDEFLAYLFDK